MERAGADAQLPGLEPGSSTLVVLLEMRTAHLGDGLYCGQWTLRRPSADTLPLLAPSAPATWAPLTKALTQHAPAHSQLTLSCTLTHTQPHTLTHSTHPPRSPPTPSAAATQDPLTKLLTQHTLTRPHSDTLTATHLHLDTCCPILTHSETLTPAAPSLWHLLFFRLECPFPTLPPHFCPNTAFPESLS